MNERDVFIAALQRGDPGERRAYLDAACRADAALRRRVDGLLEVYDRAGSFLEEPAEGWAGTGVYPPPAADPPAPALEAGSRVADRYQLLGRIGEGGMGEVWLAEQQEPVRRRVALKLIKPGMDTRQVLARFEAERQALALMDHPNIAKVLDGGATDDGRPFFVMELVEGVPITTYSDDHRLTLRERLGLFVAVCRAVQHAHQKGVIHRDLKPSNVLVARSDGRPVPKVIDFGVAKAAGEPLTEKTLVTGLGAVVGTPEYMSPEQAGLNNRDVDTRSDVYSLGVLLYELLTGTTPLTRERVKGAALLDVLRVVREEEPPRPSARLSGSKDSLPAVSARRHTDPGRLARAVRGELDWIVMKALEKDRTRRYETADGLALDVQRYLADEPVLARPPSAGYRLRKFVQRNRGPAAAGSFILLLLVAGVVGTAVGLVRADRRAEGERQAKRTAEKRLAQIENGIDALGAVFDDLDPAAEVKEGRPLRAILGDRLDRVAADLDGEAVGDPLVVARLQDRLGRAYLGLGHPAKAEPLFTKAVATRRADLGADHPLTLASGHGLARAYDAVGKRAEAVALFERVGGAQAEVLGADHPDTLTTLYDLATAYWAGRRMGEAVALLERVRDGRVRRLGGDHDLTQATVMRLARWYVTAHDQDRERVTPADRSAEGFAMAEKVVEDRVRRHGPGHPLAVAARNELAIMYRVAGKMRRALALFEQSRDAAAAGLGPDHPATLATLSHLAQMYRAFGRVPEAVALGERVREAQVLTLGARHPATLFTLHHLAKAYEADGKPEKALPLFEQAAAGVEELRFMVHDADLYVDGLCRCHERLRQYDRAEVWRRKWLAVVREKDGPDSGLYAEGLRRLGRNLLRQERPAAAEPVLRECLAALPRTPSEYWLSASWASWTTSHTRSLLGAALLGQRKYADAEPLLVQGYEGMREVAQAQAHPHHGLETDVPLTEALERLVRLYDDWGRGEQAARWRNQLEARTKAAEKAAKQKDK